MNKEATTEVIRKIELKLIDPSPFQRRRSFNEERLQELCDSIRKHGQTDAALVREMPGGRFELIAGERRMRACEMAELATLRCDVRKMSDDDARELVIIQQVQHEEWSTTEEGAGYRDLLELKDAKGKPRYTEKTLAERIGKKEGHIRELVAILDTPEEMRVAVDEGRVSKRAAATVASIPDPGQRILAAKMVLHPTDKTSPLTATETIALIQRSFVRSLQGAPFKTKDETLLREAGSCEKCPFRSGNMVEFNGLLRASDGTGTTSGIAPNLCLKPDCYRRKCEAVESKVKAEAVRRGCELMPDDEAARLFDKDGNLRENIDYVDRLGKPDPTLCHHYDESKVPTWKQLIQTSGKGTVKAWLAKNPVTGDFVELIKWQDAVKSVNDGCRELGDEIYFKAGEKEVVATAVEAAAVQPGENIFKPEPQKELWDKEADKEAKVEQKEKGRKEAERSEWIIKQMHERLALGLGHAEAHVRDRIYMAFAEEMLTLVADETVLNDMARHYGATPDVEETLQELIDKFRDMPAHDRGAFLIMVIVRKMMYRSGARSSYIAQWCEFLSIEEPEEKADDIGETHSCDCCSRKITVPPNAVADVLKLEAGEFKCEHCGGTWVPWPDEAQPIEVREKLKADDDKPAWFAEAQDVAAGKTPPAREVQISQSNGDEKRGGKKAAKKKTAPSKPDKGAKWKPASKAKLPARKGPKAVKGKKK